MKHGVGKLQCGRRCLKASCSDSGRENAALSIRKKGSGESPLAQEECNLELGIAEYERGMELWEERDVRAMAAFEEAARLGHVQAMCMLGSFIRGTRRDEAMAFAWYRKAAELGHGLAMIEVARGLTLGQGVTRNREAGLGWLERAGAAGLGHRDAMRRLGILLEETEACKSLSWYHKAAELGDLEGMFGLGRLLHQGRGARVDRVEAMIWYRKAASLGHGGAMCNLGGMLREGESGRSMANKLEAWAWYRKAAELGDVLAMHTVGVLLHRGEGVEADKVAAMVWYRKAAEMGQADSMCNIGTLFVRGDGVRKDPSEAMRWYRKAAEQGSGAGMYNVAFLLEKGEGVEADLAEAARWYRKAAEHGCVGGSHGLADDPVWRRDSSGRRYHGFPLC